MKKPKKFNSAAVITIRDADKMTAKGRRAIAEWMRKRASDLLKYGPELSGRFTARYLYR